MQPSYLWRKAHAVRVGPSWQGGSSPPEHRNHWRHRHLPALVKSVGLADCKVIFLFLNRANLIWKPLGLGNVGFHNVACTELLFRTELWFNCWNYFTMATWLQPSDLSLYSPRYTNRDTQAVCPAQGTDRFVFVPRGLVSSLPFCLASSLCTTKNIHLTPTGFQSYCSLKKTCSKETR